jgi:hypothetical protein
MSVGHLHVHSGSQERGKAVLNYEKLEVYQVSIQFVAVAVVLSGQLPKAERRAAWSIALNIAKPDIMPLRGSQPWSLARCCLGTRSHGGTLSVRAHTRGSSGRCRSKRQTAKSRVDIDQNLNVYCSRG